MRPPRLVEPIQTALRRDGAWFIVGAIVFSVSAAGLAVLAVLADSRGVRLTAATAAIVAMVGWAITWRHVERQTGSPLRRLGWWLGVVMLSFLALAGGLVGVATWFGWLLHGRPAPLDVGGREILGITISLFDVGVFLLTAGVFTLLTWWVGSLGRALTPRTVKGLGGRVLNFFAAPARRRWIRMLIAGVLVGVGVGLLSKRDVPLELNPADRRGVSERGAGRYDRLLVIDPADPASQTLIAYARELIDSGRQAALVQPPARNTEYNVAYGIAVPQARRDDRPLWRIVEPPTDDPFELAASLARIRPRDGPLAAGSYGRVLADTQFADRVRWRIGAQRAVTFVLERLPSLRALDRHVRGTATIEPWADPSTACKSFLERREIGSSLPSRPQSDPVAWGDALGELCHARSRRPVAIDVLTGERRRGRNAAWRSWAGALGGRLTVWRANPEGQRLLDVTRELTTGQPVGELRRIADYFRPHLRFDEDEQFFPVDVDWLLTPEFRQGRVVPLVCAREVDIEYGQELCAPEVPEDEINRVCDRETGEDNCQDIANAASLVGELDEFIDLAGGGRLGRDRIGKNRGPSRMYVHAREHEGRLYLGYWWFIPFNASPWRPEINCLPGLAIESFACFDHEGDWEGVTVVLDLIDERALPDPYDLSNLKPEAVHYDSHGAPISWPWELVELEADRGSRTYATHPVVYVAKSSHASYPAPCNDEECDQHLARHPSRGEGGFDGKQEWTYNDRCEEFQIGGTGTNFGSCLIALPATSNGLQGVLWNAFPGRWGKATCTVIAKFCSAVDGPKSPGRQPRFKTPWVNKPGLPGALREQRLSFGGAKPWAGDPRAWPPKGRPIPDTLRLPSTFR